MQEVLAILSSVYSDIRIVFLPLAVLGTAICGVGMMTSSDLNDRKRNRYALFTVISAAALFELAPLLTSLITGLAERLR